MKARAGLFAASTALALVMLTLVACRSGGGVSTESPGEAGARALFDREAGLTQRRDWRGLYELTTPRYRAVCPYEKYLETPAVMGLFLDFDWSQVGFDGVRVEVSGDTAHVTYTVTYKGADLVAVSDADPDVYKYVDGGWYDDQRGDTACSGESQEASGSASPLPASPTPTVIGPPAQPVETPTPVVTASEGGGLAATATAGPANGQVAGGLAADVQEAIAAVRRSGYREVDPGRWYCENCALHVMIGVGATSADGYDQRAFFFADGRYLGTDTSDSSAQVSVVWRDDTTVALSYQLYYASDPFCCPKGGAATVRFYWDGQGLSALDAIPPSAPGTQPGRY